MALPWVGELRAESWRTCSIEERLAALNRMETVLAQQERRKPCEVEEIPDGSRKISANGEPILRGRYEPIEEKIQIDPILLSDNRPPYEAVETYFHEAKHASQHYAIDHPEIHNSPEQVADWEKNDAAYIGEEDIELEFAKFSHYRWQPVEADANRVGHGRTKELYEDMFQDTTEQYQDYHANVEEEISEDIDNAIYELQTTDYEQEARLFMLAKYDAEMDMRQQSSLSPAQTTTETSSAEEVDSGEDYDYSYGYGL